jgi:hypothetical protein
MVHLLMGETCTDPNIHSQQSIINTQYTTDEDWCGAFVELLSPLTMFMDYWCWLNGDLHGSQYSVRHSQLVNTQSVS